jgi:hypothetical protein
VIPDAVVLAAKGRILLAGPARERQGGARYAETAAGGGGS